MPVRRWQCPCQAGLNLKIPKPRLKHLALKAIRKKVHGHAHRRLCSCCATWAVGWATRSGVKDVSAVWHMQVMPWTGNPIGSQRSNYTSHFSNHSPRFFSLTNLSLVITIVKSADQVVCQIRRQGTCQVVDRLEPYASKLSAVPSPLVQHCLWCTLQGLFRVHPQLSSHHAVLYRKPMCWSPSDQQQSTRKWSVVTLCTCTAGTGVPPTHTICSTDDGRDIYLHHHVSILIYLLALPSSCHLVFGCSLWSAADPQVAGLPWPGMYSWSLRSLRRPQTSRMLRSWSSSSTSAAQCHQGVTRGRTQSGPSTRSARSGGCWQSDTAAG
jgi:hypothetical protein